MAILAQDIMELLREADRLNAERGIPSQHARLYRFKQAEQLAYHKAMVERERSITQTSAAMEAARTGRSPQELEFLEEIEREMARRDRVTAKVMNAKHKAIFAHAAQDYAKRLERKKKLSDDAARMRRVKAQQAARMKGKKPHK